MRILFVHERWGSLGGAEANAQITATELARRGHSVGMLHGPATGRGEQAWQDTFRHRFALGNDPLEATRRALAEFRPEAVYVHKMPDLAVLEALLDSGVALVRMVHDHDIYSMRSYKYDYLTRRICTRAAGPAYLLPCLASVVRNTGPGLPLKWQSYTDKLREIELNRRFERMVVVTPYMREELLRNRFDADRIRVHAPVPRPGVAGVRSNFSERNLILYAGQIIRGKGVDVLLQALAKIRTPFECVILGEGNHRAACEKLSRRLGLEQRVHFKGYVSQETLQGYYRECSVVALPSVWPEPIATIGLEVMRYGLPVVGFDAGGIKDWLLDGQNGFLVPWMDVGAMAGRLEQLLGDKALARQMGAAGLELVSNRYDFEGYIGDLEALFAEVFAEKQTANARAGRAQTLELVA